MIVAGDSVAQWPRSGRVADSPLASRVVGWARWWWWDRFNLASPPTCSPGCVLCPGAQPPSLPAIASASLSFNLGSFIHEQKFF